MMTGVVLAGGPEEHYLRGVAHYVKVVRGEDRPRHIELALDAFDCAIALDAEHYPAILYRALTLRQQAAIETDAKKKQALLAAADAARARAIEMVRKGKARKVEPDPMAIR